MQENKSENKLTDTQNKFLGYLAGNGNNIADACRQYEIERDEFDDWLKNNELFRKEYNKSIRQIGDNVKSALYREALEGNVQAGVTVLEHAHTAPKKTDLDPLGLDIFGDEEF